MDREQFRKAGYQAIDWICDYFEKLETLDVMPSVQPGDVGKQIPDTAPEKGEEWDVISGDFDKIIMPGITHWQHPSFFAYFPANSTYESILADIMVGGVSNPGFNWLCSPACTELEVRMMDWCASMFGLDQSFHNSSKEGGGIILGSASEACLTVCIAARERLMRILPNTKHEDLVIVATTQTHSLGAKAALLLGVGFEAVETKKEHDWGLKGEELKGVLQDLKEKGKVPFIVLATLGSTSTGAIDDVAEITAVSNAAWAGVFLSLPELREECNLEAINARSKAKNTENGICSSGEVHSFCTNLHKSGLVTFDASLLFIRDRRLLTEALDVTPPFLRNKKSDSGLVVDYRNWQIALGRRFRSLKLWFVLRSYGIDGFRKHLRSLNELAKKFEKLVIEDPGFELFTKRRFSLVVLRLKGSDELNKAFFAKIAERNDLHLTPTVVGGSSCTRIAVGSPFTKEEHVDKAWNTIKEVAEETRKALK